MSRANDEGFRHLNDARLNKGTAFTNEERLRLGIHGLLPPRRLTQQDQANRVLESVRGAHDDLERHIQLMALLDRNERLFFRVVQDHLEEMLPILYTPTVGEACKKFAHIYRRPRGLYVTTDDRGRVADVLRNWPERDVRVLVVTDGERILGLGDLGASGMGIPIGKLILYTAGAGIDPARCLPVMLDVGTNNESLRADTLYLGLQRPRLEPARYDELFDELVVAIGEVFPRAMIQCEDFANRNARRLLEAYRDRVCIFNDDMQGTAAVALAGLYGAIRITRASLNDQRVLFVGAGTAGVGIADLLVSALVDDGMAPDAARSRCRFVDSKGLVVKGRERIKAETLPYAHEGQAAPDLRSAVRSVRPTALIGVSGRPGLFTEAVVRAMAELNSRPIVFPLSNPTASSECTAEQAYRWSDGRAVVATGSPFGPVEIAGNRFVPRQGNNAYIFPGLGMGIVAAGATRVTEAMFRIAARVLASAVDESDLRQGSIFPPIRDVRGVSRRIAAAVAEEAHAAGVASEPRPDDLNRAILELEYDPTY